ncbi:jg23294, partial [Pararge aegeria aegeria]
DTLRGRRSASLRSAAPPPRAADEPGPSTPLAPHRAFPSSTETRARKSNWEVIEHFSPNRARQHETVVST